MGPRRVLGLLRINFGRDRRIVLKRLVWIVSVNRTCYRTPNAGQKSAKFSKEPALIERRLRQGFECVYPQPYN